ncbi:MAG: ribosome maturation factor RimP [Chitinophagales bacterium]
MESLQSKIAGWLQAKLEEMNCYLVDIRVLNGGKKVEVYIDNNESPVTIAECEAVSRFLEFHLDNDATVMRNYNLEVSSPGMDNPFKVPQQYVKNTGRWVEILMLSGLKKEGILRAADQKELTIEIQHPSKKKGMLPDSEMQKIAFTEIKSVKKKVVFK